MQQTKQAGARPKVVRERTIARRVDLPQASPDALVRGYGTALADILAQLVPELGTENVNRQRTAVISSPDRSPEANGRLETIGSRGSGG